MPTNEERREVARMLRDIADRLGGNMDCHEFAHYVADAVIGKEKMTLNELTLTVAALIEPEPEQTCKNVSEWGTNDTSVNFDFICSACGAHVYPDDYGQTPLKIDNYYSQIYFCPYCGAKVINNANE